VADPDGTLATEISEQLEHVVNAVFECVVGVGVVVRGVAVTAHVRGDAAEPEGGKTAELVSPAMRQLRPAVDEDDQGAGFRATGEVKLAWRAVLLKWSVTEKSIAEVPICLSNRAGGRASVKALAGPSYRKLGGRRTTFSSRQE
jgi:hypothetical protein